MGLSQQQREQVKDIANLAVREYFDHYLTKVFPEQVKGIEAKIRAHDVNVFAHGGIVRRFARFKYTLLGFAAGGGFLGGVSLKTLMSLFG